MKKINGFTITRLTMSGFKCFETDVSFDLGDTTFITASNGQGKSTFADAIAFAFVGTPFFGDRGLDRLQNRNSQEMRVSVDFIDDTGEPHNLIRSRKNDTTSITYDGLTVRQSDLNSAFADKDIFLSILNPLYFINVLGDGGKNLLEKLLPVVPHEKVMESLPESSREILEDQELLPPEAFIKKRRGELKTLEEALIGYRSQKELLDHQREERASKLGEFRAAIGGISGEMAELVSIRDKDRDIAAEEITLAELRKRRDELLSDATDSDTDKALQETMAEIRAVEKNIARIDVSQYVSPHTARITEIETELKVLYDEHSRLNKALTDTVIGHKCPVCMIEITSENIETVRAGLQRRLSVLVSDGKTAKNNLAEIKVQDELARDEFDKQKSSDLETENNKLAALDLRLQEINVASELDRESYGERLAALENQIREQEYQLAYGNWSEEQAAQFTGLGETKKGYEAQTEALSGTNDHDYTTLIAETEAEVVVVKRLIAEAVQYMAKRIELMLDGLKMDNTEIVLTELVKTTGEIKDCFRFSYDGRDYKCLSLSEKVRAGLEVAILLQRLSGRNYPIFVDNGESICTLGNVHPTGQVMIARVVNKQALQVTYRNRESSEMSKMAA